MVKQINHLLITVVPLAQFLYYTCRRASNLRRPGVSTVLVGARTVPEIEENVVGATRQVSEEDMAAADAATREVFESLPRVPDMFQNWENWELQRRRYERDGQFPAAATA